MKSAVIVSTVLGIAGSAFAQVRITEWMYSGANGEFFELTNVGNAPVDLTGWSYDDDSATPGVLSLSPLGVLMPGESAVLTESSEAAFRAAWGLAPTVKIIGGYTNNLGRNDQINIFDSSNAIADRLTYGDEVFIGSIRTQNISGNPMTPAALGADDVYQWIFAAPGDAFGSYFSSGGDLGNPGIYVPGPGAAVLAGLGLMSCLRRRR